MRPRGQERGEGEDTSYNFRIMYLLKGRFEIWNNQVENCLFVGFHKSSSPTAMNVQKQVGWGT